MAKSLRASNKVKARNARRYTPNTDYAIRHAARLNAIAKRLAERTQGPTVFEAEEQAAKGTAETANVEATNESSEQGDKQEVQGWYLICDSTNTSERMRGRGDNVAVDADIDLSLLGLIDADVISVEETSTLSKGVDYSALDWMFPNV